MGTPYTVTVDDVFIDDVSQQWRYVVPATPGSTLYVCLAAVAHHPSLPALQSPPTNAISVLPHSLRGPAPPAPPSAVRATGNGSVTVSFTGDSNPTTQYMLLRNLVGGPGNGTPVTHWTPTTAAATVTLVDSDAPEGVQYVVACTNESGRVTYSSPVPA